MKPFARDLSITILFKIILLVLLWWFCVRGMHPVLSSSKEWFLGKQQTAVLSHNTDTR